MCACASLPRDKRVTSRRDTSPRHDAMLRCCALALLCAAALATADRDRDRPRRAEMSPVPFVMGSRYGRSMERVMAPRNDRFFMGSRYGKRSEPAVAAAAAAEGALLCRYTGIATLYKCMRAHKQLQFGRQSTDDASPGDQ